MSGLPVTQPGSDPSAEHADGAVDEELEGDQEDIEEDELQPHVPEFRSDELGQERDGAGDHLRVE